MPDIKAIQAEMRTSKIDGWLFCDHHHRDPIAARILGLDGHAMATRRWFYFIPSRGEPRKLVHRIESGMLDSLPGNKQVYSGWEELHKGVAKLLGAARTIAMQYSPENNIPYIGLVDAGTIELVRKLKKKVVTSADLVQKFEAAWTAEQLASHLEAGAILDRIAQAAFERAAAFVRDGRPITEYELQQWMLERFRANELTTAEPPIAAVQPKTGILTTSRRPPHRVRFVRATFCCSIFGPSASGPAASITTLPGRVIWASACRMRMRRFFASCGTREIARSSS